VSVPELLYRRKSSLHSLARISDLLRSRSGRFWCDRPAADLEDRFSQLHRKTYLIHGAPAPADHDDRFSRAHNQAVTELTKTRRYLDCKILIPSVVFVAGKEPDGDACGRRRLQGRHLYRSYRTA
jgi:hypothetical protein